MHRAPDGEYAMSESADDSSTSFHRQRRDLFVISAILILAQLTNAEPHKLNFLGVEIDIRNAAVLTVAAWLLRGYWLVRYLQALNDLPPATITGNYHNLLPERAVAISRGDAIKETIRQIKLKDNKGVWRHLPPQPTAHGGHQHGYKVGWKLQAGDATAEPYTFPQEYPVNFSGRKLTMLKIRTFIYMIFCTKTFTEYLLPPLFALCPAAIWLYRHLT
jgi:hypothetical protein